MSVEAFLDTNVLLYALSKNPDEENKSRAANALITRLDFGVSAQVCQEFYVVATGKLRQTIERPRAQEFLKLLFQRPLVMTTPALIESAIKIQEQFQLSYWDSAIVAAATALDAKILYSEDFSHGQFYGSVQVLNPFVIKESLPKTS